MNLTLPLDAQSTDPGVDRILKVAILAVGGQGGGVLTGWIEGLARANGYAAQATSVAGVAQRTGATVYYVEMAPYQPGQPMPVFSLMPMAGDVDVMIAAEMMEAGRAILRGFVTPDRTVLIASTHRALAVSEKMVPGDGIASSEEVLAAAEVAARQVIAHDFEALAVANGSVISASLFGALAGAGVLPFDRPAFEGAIRAGGKGVEASLRAFSAGFNQAVGQAPAAPPPASRAKHALRGPAALVRQWQALEARVDALPSPVGGMVLPGLRKVADFQDLAYAASYLDLMEAVLSLDDAGHGWVLTCEAAKHIANAMAYDDLIRVADLKTRAQRFTRIWKEMDVNASRVLHLTEFFHPRAEEIVGLLPRRLGARLQGDPKWMVRLDRWFNRGRRLRTDSLPAFLTLHVLGGLRRWRLRTLRHAQEMAHLDRWLQTALAEVPRNYHLAVELLRCRRLIKGYSDTHARGQSKFDRVLAASVRIAAREDAADWCRRLREAALKDEEGKALDGAIRTIESFT